MIGGRPDAGDDPDEWWSQEDGFRSAAEAASAVSTAIGSATAMVSWESPATDERRDRLAQDASDADLCATVFHSMAGACREIADHAAASADELERLRSEHAAAPDEDQPRILAAIDECIARHSEATAPLRHRLSQLALELEPVLARADALAAYFSPVVADDPQGEQVVDAGQVAEYLRTGVLADR